MQKISNFEKINTHKTKNLNNHRQKNMGARWGDEEDQDMPGISYLFQLVKYSRENKIWDSRGEKSASERMLICKVGDWDPPQIPHPSSTEEKKQMKTWASTGRSILLNKSERKIFWAGKSWEICYSQNLNTIKSFPGLKSSKVTTTVTSYMNTIAEVHNAHIDMYKHTVKK